jgi:hypothetical protein
MHANVFCSVSSIRQGNEKIRLHFFNADGAILDSSLNRQSYIKGQPYLSNAERGVIFPGINCRYFKDGINDTIYAIDTSIKPKPIYLLNLGKYQMPYEIFSNSLEDFSKKCFDYIILNQILENENYLFMIFEFGKHFPFKNVDEIPVSVFGTTLTSRNTNVAAIYDKRTSTFTLLDGENGMGFSNDIDGGISFWPSFIDHYNNEMYTWKNAFEIIDKCNEISESNIKSKDKNAYKNFKSFAAGLEANGNPVIIKVTGLLKSQ